MRIESFRLYENLCGGKLGGAKGARAPAENVGKKVTVLDSRVGDGC